jgi:uncharacterized membrane-anchored protein
MNRKDILKQIKDIMTFSTEEERPEAFADAKTVDGIIIRVEGEAFEKDAQLLIVSEDGAIAAQPGEYILEDGTIIIADEGGLITEVRLPEVAEVIEEMGEEVKEEELEEVKEDLEEEVKEEIKEEVIEELTKRMEAIEEMVKKMAEDKEDFKAFSKAFTAKIDEFIKDTPAELTFKSIKTEYKSTIEEKKNVEVSNLDKIKSLRKK